MRATTSRVLPVETYKVPRYLQFFDDVVLGLASRSPVRQIYGQSLPVDQ